VQVDEDRIDEPAELEVEPLVVDHEVPEQPPVAAQVHCSRAVNQSDSSDHVGGLCLRREPLQFIQFAVSMWLWLKSCRLAEVWS